MSRPDRHPGAGPLAGVRVVEFAGLGPVPFACMLLSDMGADVVTVERPGRRVGARADVIGRGRTVVVADLKETVGRAAVLELVDRADALVEGFRPGVMERLGLGPDVAAARNPRLVYARMTGWGQEGPLAASAGHDINYIALSGALHAIGARDGAPVPPLNLVGDYGGGSLYLAMGILAALHERTHSGCGQVVDAAILDGTLSLMSLSVSQAARGEFVERRGENALDGGAPAYGTYATADGQHLAIGALEPAFFSLFCKLAGLPAHVLAWQQDRAKWPELRAEIAKVIGSRTREEWTSVFDGTDACVTPVLSLGEAPAHPHLAARRSFIEVGGLRQPAPAPRFSRTPGAQPRPAPTTAVSISDVLDRWRPSGEPWDAG